jgi:hypothetical protein
MGTSGAYSGSGGKDGKAARDAISDYLDSPQEQTEAGEQGQTDGDRPRVDPAALQHIINIIRPRSPAGGGGDGPSGGGGGGRTSGESTRGSRSGGGPQRSAARSARTAGRAAAAAYAYQTGDADTLQRLGLDYAELNALGDRFEVLRRIVDMACSSSDSTIEDHEQRLVAADIAERVMGPEGDGYIPSLEEIVREAIAMIIVQAYLSESGHLINSSNRAELAEKDIRDAAEVMASKATLSVDGATEEEITRAIESGLETLNTISGSTA